MRKSNFLFFIHIFTSYPGVVALIAFFISIRLVLINFWTGLFFKYVSGVIMQIATRQGKIRCLSLSPALIKGVNWQTESESTRQASVKLRGKYAYLMPIWPGGGSAYFA